VVVQVEELGEADLEFGALARVERARIDAAQRQPRLAEIRAVRRAAIAFEPDAPDYEARRRYRGRVGLGVVRRRQRLVVVPLVVEPARGRELIGRTRRSPQQAMVANPLQALYLSWAFGMLVL
jgi:hypothetical protein